MATPMSGRTTGAHELIFASAWPEEDERGGSAELGEKIGAEIADGVIAEKFQHDAVEKFSTALILLSPPGSEGKTSLTCPKTASEFGSATSFALLISGVVGALPRLVLESIGVELASTDAATSFQKLVFSNVNAWYRLRFT